MQIALHDLCNWLDIAAQSENSMLFGACVDTRELKQGQVFFALQGQRSDGHMFLQEAVDKGASAIVIEEQFQGRVPDTAVLRVPDTLKALQDAARGQFSRMQVKVIAITGSFGKTTTKEWLKTLLAERFRVGATKGNQNSQVGLPLTLLNELQGDEDYLVLEMGMTTKGHIANLVALTPPDIAIVTHIGLIHAENFQSVEEIAEAKREIFSHPKTKQVLINKEAAAFDTLVANTDAQVLTYVQGKRADETFGIMLSNNKWQYEEKGFSKELTIPELTAEHLGANCLAAIATAKLCGVSWPEMKQGLQKITPYENRMQVAKKKGITFINDSYNAGETTTVAALRHLQKNPGRKIAVLGGITELGAFEKKAHETVAECALLCADRLFCYGQEAKMYVDVWQKNNRDVFFTSDFSALIEALQKTVVAGDSVLLKGSNSFALWRVLDHF